jgi:16S rRNA processing protein RimM
MRRVEIGRLGLAVGLEGGLRYRGQPLPRGVVRVFVEGLGYRSLRGPVAEDLLTLAGIDSRQAALDLVGKAIFLDEDQLPPLEEGQYYYFQLVDQPVWVDGEEVGRVVAVEEAGPQDLLRLDLGQPYQPLVPLQAPYVRVVDRGVEIDPIPGLFEP